MSDMEKAKELEQELGRMYIGIYYEVPNNGAWRGVGIHSKTFSGDHIEEAREFAKRNDCIACEITDSHGHQSEKIRREFWRMVHEWDALKAAVPV